MRKLILLMTVCAMWVTNGALLAQDAKASKEQKVESIRKLRTQVLSKLPALADIFDGEHNGMTVAYAALQKQWQEGLAAANKRVDSENSKSGDARDQAALDQAIAKVARLQAVWANLANKFFPAFGQKWNSLTTTRNNLVPLINDLAAQDQVWLRAECDPAVLVAVFTELNNRVDELKEQATMDVTEYIKRCNDDERACKE